LLNNTTAQTNALITNLKKSQTSLSRAGVLTGKESPTAISGVILAGATVGVPATLSFVQLKSSTQIERLANNFILKVF
jgi:hypothetical protein